MFRDFFMQLPRNALSIFLGKNLLWHGLAISLTALLVISGADWWYYEHTRYTFLYPAVWFAGLGGFFLPVVVPVCMYVIGELRTNMKMMLAASAVAQSEIIASVLAVLYKTFTGRIQPDFIYSIGTIDISREFQFGFLRHGIFWGWPSSHAAVAFAGALALALAYRSRPFQFLVLACALAIAFGASVGFHWLSDVIAGAILGCLTAVVVSRSYHSGSDTIARI